MCKWRNVAVEAGKPSNVTGAQQVLPLGKPNKSFRVSPFHLRPRTVHKIVQNYQDKLVKLFCIPCTHKSLACVQSNKGPLSTLPEQNRHATQANKSLNLFSWIYTVRGSQWDGSFEVIFVFNFDD